MVTIYYDKDADLKYLKGKKIAIIGYGSQGMAQSHNLKDSGLDVVVGLRKGGESWNLAKKEGMKVATVEEAAQQGDVIQMLIPDELQGKVYKEQIEPYMKKGKTLMFSHGFNIRYGMIKPGKDIDVIMIAPKSPGHLVRRMYQEGVGVPSLIAIEQDASGKARQIGLAYAMGIGSTKAGVIETTFTEETETDLFGEQVDLCGGVTEMVKASFETLVEAGYQPEIAYFETLHELKLIVDLMYEGGMTNMWDSVSDTAQYGGLTRGKRVINDESRMAMWETLLEIQDGRFAKEWVLENVAGRPVFNSLTKMDAEHQIETVGKELRSMMPWLKKKK
ncbi:MAG: ketol-acid reductoisomerase [Methanocella sp.]